MASGVFGYFRFSLAGISLNGGFLNKYTSCFELESGTQTTAGASVFEGTYDTQWKDPYPKTGSLVISKQGNIYSLSWNVLITGERYEGKGIIEKGDLAGFYEKL